MLQVYAGGILMVLGMVALLGNPVVGGAMIGIGFAMYKSTSKATRSDAASTFWGFGILCGAGILLVGLVNVLFF
ncbi:hypothetical protein [Pseudomonas sp. SO81]|uniref:hypothetical protein n=1 Tax=Pseudomonas sp. SO81 TaxID=2983246 RepID=UPI0025A4863B|nr:hypothetical protein [Pseudomonas sp. SO81]WJN61377.1 hypothetical protein OH686_21765 [Pseudomonas sp. SO81]